MGSKGSEVDYAHWLGWCHCRQLQCVQSAGMGAGYQTQEAAPPTPHLAFISPRSTSLDWVRAHHGIKLLYVPTNLQWASFFDLCRDFSAFQFRTIHVFGLAVFLKKAASLLMTARA